MTPDCHESMMLTLASEVLPSCPEDIGDKVCLSVRLDSSSTSSSSSLEASLRPWYHSLVRRCISTLAA